MVINPINGLPGIEGGDREVDMNNNEPDVIDNSDLTNPEFRGGIVNGNESNRLNQSALNMIGDSTCSVINTGNGSLACAYVVNDIVNDALGKPITGRSNDPNSYGRLTAQMYRDLRTSDRFFYAGSSINDLQPGDIIISPTVGRNIGHVGVYTSTGKIVSNSSRGRMVDDNYTPQSWVNYYTGKGLDVHIFRAGTSN